MRDSENKQNNQYHWKHCYCETHKTVNTRNIYGMLLCYEELANKARGT